MIVELILLVTPIEITQLQRMVAQAGGIKVEARRIFRSGHRLLRQVGRVDHPVRLQRITLYRGYLRQKRRQGQQHHKKNRKLLF